MNFWEKTYLVSPAEFYVTGERNAVLETYLGSCVGVTLYDPTARVGGLAHIVLPSGDQKREAVSPGKYATSVIPLVIKKMLELGASKGRMVAKMAGGASIYKNFNLDIGRRNALKAKEILELEGIPILEEDVGGNFGRVLRMKMENGEINLRQIGQGLRDTPPPAVVRGVEFRDILKEIDHIEPLPETVRQALALIDADPEDSQELKGIIYQDQALTADMLKICNSAYYGFSRRISSLSHAIVLLGFKTIKKILLSLSLRNILFQKIPSYSLGKGEMFKHALACGLTAELMARELGRDNDSEKIFTAALLHDIGKIVLDLVAFDKFGLIMDMVVKGGRSFLSAEKEILGYTHAQVGAMIARQWNLPLVLIEAIEYHHEPGKAQVAPEVVAMVHVADVICSMLGVGGGVDGLVNPVHPGALSLLALDAKAVENIIEGLPEVMKQIEPIEAHAVTGHTSTALPAT